MCAHNASIKLVRYILQTTHFYLSHMVVASAGSGASVCGEGCGHNVFESARGVSVSGCTSRKAKSAAFVFIP